MKKILSIGSTALLALSLAACTAKTSTPEVSEVKEEVTEAMEEMQSVKFAVMYGAAHGDKCFSTAAVVVDEKTGQIVNALVDEYQYFDASSEGLMPVPNTDAKFAEGSVEGKVLASKRVNSEFYSEHMKEKAGSTVAYAESMNAIQDYAKGKTVEELRNFKADTDTVTGATLVDTPNYLALIADTAEQALASEKSFEVSSEEALVIKSAESVANADDSFTLVAVVVDGDKLVATYLDEFQYADASEQTMGVPNSDGKFAENYAEGKVLVSKKVNTAWYSKLMTDIANATNTIDGNFMAIEDYAAGKTVEELKAFKADTDTVTGATLVGTPSYILSIVNAVENSK